MRTRMRNLILVAAAALAAGLLAAPPALANIPGNYTFTTQHGVSFTLLSGDTVSLANGLLRALGIAAYVVVALLGLVAIGLFISTLTDVPVGAIAATMVVVILSGVLDAVPQLHAIHPWLVTHWWASFGDLLRSPVRWTDIEKNVALQLVYVSVFGAAAWARFTTKDVLA